MTGAAGAPSSGGRAGSRGAPLLVTAGLPPAVLGWTDALRRAHYPPRRNRLPAHVTLFHALPPSAEAVVRTVLKQAAAEFLAPEAAITGVMPLDSGTALAVASPGMEAIHAHLAGMLHGLVQQKDARPLRLHITVQDKAELAAVAALRHMLARRDYPIGFAFAGLELYRWDGARWRFDHAHPFRGKARADG